MERDQNRPENPWRGAIGPVMLPHQAEKVLGLSPEELAEKVERSEVLELQTKDGRKVYPFFQITEKGMPDVLPGLPDILKLFKSAEAEYGPEIKWTLASLLRRPLTSLDEKSIADSLREGADLVRVKRSAENALTNLLR